jgi:hypothetical protein
MTTLSEDVLSLRRFLSSLTSNSLSLLVTEFVHLMSAEVNYTVKSVTDTPFFNTDLVVDLLTLRFNLNSYNYTNLYNVVDVTWVQKP